MEARGRYWERTILMDGQEATMDEVAEKRHVLLLGDSGMGKSWVLEELRLRQVAKGEACPEVIKLGECIARADLDTDLEVALSWNVDEHRLTLYLDSVDELALKDVTLPRRLWKLLRAKARERELRLRLSCRSAALRIGWLEELEELTGDDLHLVTLADVKPSAVLESFGEEFVHELTKRNVMSWTGHPSTLRLLVNYWKAHRALPPDRHTLYHEALHQLLTEQNEVWSEHSSAPEWEQLIRAARRVAAGMALSGRQALVVPPLKARVEPIPTAFNFEDARAGRHPIDRAELRALGQSKLFRVARYLESGATIVVCREQPLLELLAAEHILECNPSVERARTLLEDPSTDDPSIASPVSGVLGWLVELSDDWLTYSIDLDPLSSLNAADKLGAEGRARILSTLHAKFMSGELPAASLWGVDRSKTLKLRHPKVAEQLTTFLSVRPDDEAGWMAWLLAVMAAMVLQVSEVAGLIAARVSDPETPLDVRKNAASYFIDVRAGREPLLPIALGEADAASIYLRCKLIQACWPDLLTTDQLLEAFDPEQGLLHRRMDVTAVVTFKILVAQFESGDLVKLLDWWAALPRAYQTGAVMSSILSALQRIEPRLDEPALFEAVARNLDTMLEELPARGSWFPHTSLERRLSLFARAREVTPGDGRPPLYTPDLFTHADFAGLLDVGERSEGDDRALALETALSVFLREDVEHLDLLLRARVWVEEEEWVGRFLTRYGETVEAIQASISAEREAQQEERRRRYGRTEPEPVCPDPPSTLSRVLTMAEEEETPKELLGLWGQCLTVLSVTPDSTHWPEYLRGPAQELPGWRAADEASRRRLRELALQVVLRCDLNSAEWFGASSYPGEVHDLHAAFQLLALRPSRLEELGASAWQRHAGVILDVASFNANPMTVDGWRGELVRLVQEHAPEAAAGAVEAYIGNVLARSDGQQLHFRDLRRFAGAFPSPAMADILSERLRAPSALPREAELQFIRALLVLPGGEAIITKHVHRRMAELSAGSAAPLAAALFHHNPVEHADLLRPPTHNIQEWGRAFTDSLVDELSTFALLEHPVWLRGVSSAELLGELLVLLVESWPEVHESSPAGFLGAAFARHRLWSSLLVELRDRGAHEVLRQVAESLGRPRWIEHVLSESHARGRALRWTPPDIKTIYEVLEREGQHVTRPEHLLERVIRHLKQIEEEDIRGEQGLLNLLWVPRKVGPKVAGWRPRDENDLSDQLARRLRQRDPDLLVTRESELKRRRGDDAGQEIDLLIKHPSSGHQLVVEVKPSWSEEFTSAIGVQLSRYMRESPQCTAGLYLAAWFGSTFWDSKDKTRKGKAQAHVKEREELEVTFQEQAKTLETQVNKPIRVHHLDLHLEASLLAHSPPSPTSPDTDSSTA